MKLKGQEAFFVGERTLSLEEECEKAMGPAWALVVGIMVMRGRVVIWKGADERGIKNNKWTYAGIKSNAC